MLAGQLTRELDRSRVLLTALSPGFEPATLFSYGVTITTRPLRDHKKIVGMNIANDHKKPQKMIPGMDGDANIEDTLLRKQIVVTKMLDYIAELVNKQPIFHDKKRSKHFASVAMTSRGYNEDSFRADAGAFLYSGLLKSRANGVLTAQCKMHRDAHNDHRCENGANQSICYSEMMEMKFGNRTNVVFGRGHGISS